MGQPSAAGRRYDRAELVARLREAAPRWVPQLFPNGRREGDDWRLANIRGDAPRKSGSCVITLKGARAGDWHDFDGDDGGDPLDAVAQATKLTGRELFEYAARLVGVSAAPATQCARSQERPRPETPPSAAMDAVLVGAALIAGTAVERYLRNRELPAPITDDLLFHPKLLYQDDRSHHPAMIGIVRSASGERIALHRTYLRADGGGKADVPKPRKLLGSPIGGAVRLAEPGPVGALGISEGIESGLAAMTACPELPVWAALSAGNLEKIQLPPDAQQIVILADNDASGTGQHAAAALATRLVAEGRQVAIALPPRPDEDFNDLLLRDGAGAVRRAIEAARPQEPAAVETDHDLPIAFEEPDGILPELRADEGDLARAVRNAWELLRNSNQPPWLYRASGGLTWVVHDDDGRPVPKPLDQERLRLMLAKLATWLRQTRMGDLVPAHPPMAVVKAILATPNPELPVLAGIVATPTFGRNGVLLTEPGYHPDARLLYRPPPGFTVPPIPERPSASEIAAARGLLLDELLVDFPFTGPSERAHALGLLLLGFLRSMVDGPTPLHLIEKPTPGTGGTLMVEAISTVLTGAGATIMTEGRGDEDWRKRLTARLRQMPSLLLIDNVRRPLDASSLAAALTATTWEDRILGTSDTVRIPIRCIWIATGNNPDVSSEMARRLVRIRLDAGVDRPWLRVEFRHPNLTRWVRTNRAKLVAACLTLCQAWIIAGRPAGSRTVGSYEAWAATIGGVLEVAGVEGFLGNIDEMMEAADAEGAVWRSFIWSWWERHCGDEVGVGDLFQLASAMEPPLPLGEGNDRSQRTRLGKALGRMRDRTFRLDEICVRVDALRVSHKSQRWRLAPIEGRSA